MLLAFVKEEPAKAASMVAAIQKLADANKGLKVFVVFTAGPEWGKEVEKLGAEKGITIPMTILPQGTSAPDYGKWKVNPEAKSTILLYSRRQVHANFVNVDAKSWADVEKATAEMLAK